jgi:hypothetical protein
VGSKRLYAMKSHDHHVMVQQILLIECVEFVAGMPKNGNHTAWEIISENLC